MSSNVHYKSVLEEFLPVQQRQQPNEEEDEDEDDDNEFPSSSDTGCSSMSTTDSDDNKSENNTSNNDTRKSNVNDDSQSSLENSIHLHLDSDDSSYNNNDDNDDETDESDDELPTSLNDTFVLRRKRQSLSRQSLSRKSVGNASLNSTKDSGKSQENDCTTDIKSSTSNNHEENYLQRVDKENQGNIKANSISSTLKPKGTALLNDSKQTNTSFQSSSQPLKSLQPMQPMQPKTLPDSSKSYQPTHQHITHSSLSSYTPKKSHPQPNSPSKLISNLVLNQPTSNLHQLGSSIRTSTAINTTIDTNNNNADTTAIPTAVRGDNNDGLVQFTTNATTSDRQRNEELMVHEQSQQQSQQQQHQKVQESSIPQPLPTINHEKRQQSCTSYTSSSSSSSGDTNTTSSYSSTFSTGTICNLQRESSQFIITSPLVSFTRPPPPIDSVLSSSLPTSKPSIRTFTPIHTSTTVPTSTIPPPTSNVNMAPVNKDATTKEGEEKLRPTCDKSILSIQPKNHPPPTNIIHAKSISDVNNTTSAASDTNSKSLSNVAIPKLNARRRRSIAPPRVVGIAANKKQQQQLQQEGQEKKHPSLTQERPPIGNVRRVEPQSPLLSRTITNLSCPNNAMNRPRIHDHHESSSSSPSSSSSSLASSHSRSLSTSSPSSSSFTICNFHGATTITQPISSTTATTNTTSNGVHANSSTSLPSNTTSHVVDSPPTNHSNRNNTSLEQNQVNHEKNDTSSPSSLSSSSSSSSSSSRKRSLTELQSQSTNTSSIVTTSISTHTSNNTDSSYYNNTTDVVTAGDNRTHDCAKKKLLLAGIVSNSEKRSRQRNARNTCEKHRKSLTRRTTIHHGSSMREEDEVRSSGVIRCILPRDSKAVEDDGMDNGKEQQDEGLMQDKHAIQKGRDGGGERGCLSADEVPKKEEEKVEALNNESKYRYDGGLIVKFKMSDIFGDSSSNSSSSIPLHTEAGASSIGTPPQQLQKMTSTTKAEKQRSDSGGLVVKFKMSEIFGDASSRSSGISNGPLCMEEPSSIGTPPQQQIQKMAPTKSLRRSTRKRKSINPKLARSGSGSSSSSSNNHNVSSWDESSSSGSSRRSNHSSSNCDLPPNTSLQSSRLNANPKQSKSKASKSPRRSSQVNKPMNPFHRVEPESAASGAEDSVNKLSLPSHSSSSTSNSISKVPPSLKGTSTKIRHKERNDSDESSKKIRIKTSCTTPLRRSPRRRKTISRIQLPSATHDDEEQLTKYNGHSLNNRDDKVSNPKQTKSKNSKRRKTINPFERVELESGLSSLSITSDSDPDAPSESTTTNLRRSRRRRTLSSKALEMKHDKSKGGILANPNYDDETKQVTNVAPPLPKISEALDDFTSVRESLERDVQTEAKQNIESLDTKKPVHFDYVPSSSEIRKYILDVFDSSGDVLKKPCVSARLFASLLLIEEQERFQERNYTLPKHFLPLLKAMVHAELTSLNDKTGSSVTKTRKLTFCSFDSSSTVSPVDIIDGSNMMLENCLVSLYQVVQQAELLKKEMMDGEKTKYIKYFILNLKHFESEEDYSIILDECSKSMPCRSWPLPRFKKGSNYYRNEFETILHCTASSSVTIIKKSTPIRHRLGDFIGRVIRYYLRRFFNPIPFPSVQLSQSDDAHIYYKCRSRVHEIVAMQAPSDGSMDTAAADGSISCVFGIALLRIYQFWDLNDHVMKDKDTKYIYEYCNSEISQRGLSQNGEKIRLTQQDLDEIIRDISDCHSVLTGVRACAFVQKLLTNPDVAEAIKDMGGWDKVEQYAKIYMECGLHHDCPEEIHFTMLHNVSSLIERITRDQSEFESIEKKCEECLRKMWKRFRCGTRNKGILSLNPGIKVIQQILKTGDKSLLPDLVPASSIIYEE